jgi:hypothetical protein
VSSLASLSRPSDPLLLALECIMIAGFWSFPSPMHVF